MPPDKLDPGLRCKSAWGLSATLYRELLDLTTYQIPCLLSAGGAAGCSNALDLGCQCKVAPQIRSLAAPCVLSKCGPDLGSTLQSVAEAICTQCNV
jgi:hypothetical protein